MKKKIWWIVCLLCTVLWMTVIFGYSAQHATQSSQNSDEVVDSILNTVYPQSVNLDHPAQNVLKDHLTWIVRKCAHMGEYAILAILLYNLCVSLPIPFFNHWKIGISLAVCTLYACSDEFHQRFVPGRSGEIRDVFIDFCGALMGVGIIHLIYMFISIKRKKSSEE